MTWLVLAKRFWDEKIVKYTVIAVSIIVAILIYGGKRERKGVKKEQAADAIRDQNKLDEIEENSDEVIRRADEVSVNSGAYDDDRLSDEPLPDHHYRD